MAIILAFGTVE